MFNVTRTGVGASIQTAKYLGAQHDILPNTTVNQSLTDPLVVPFQPSPVSLGMEVVDSYDALTDTNNLYLRYMVIGNKGHRHVITQAYLPQHRFRTLPLIADYTALYRSL